MKGLLVYPTLLASLLLLPLLSWAQEGTVTYEETVQLDIQLPPEMAHMQDEMPSSRTARYHLHFNTSASLMKALPAEGDSGDSDVTASHGGMNVRIHTLGPGDTENAIYVDFDAGETIEKRDFLGRTFLITGSLEPLAWRLTNERSEFLGYMTQKAVAMRDSTTIEAWFTPEIPVQTGPESYGGLPGLILVLNLDDGRNTFVAKEVALGEVDTSVLVAPRKGKKVTRAEFDEIVEEKRREMEVDGNGNTFIVRQQN